MSISVAGVPDGAPVEVTVQVGLPDGDHTIDWVGRLTLCPDSYCRLESTGVREARPSDHFWLHQRPDDLVALESFDGRFVVMWFRRLSARTVTHLSLQWQTFSTTAGIDRGVLVGDKDRTGRYLTLESLTDEPAGSPGHAAAAEGSSQPHNRIMFSGDKSDAVQFKFVLTAEQHRSPRELLSEGCGPRNSVDDRKDMAFVRKAAVWRHGGVNAGWCKEMIPGLADGIVAFEAIGQLLEDVETAPEPQDKLSCLLLVRRELERQSAAAGMTSLGADELMPMLVLCLVWSPVIAPTRHIEDMMDAVEEGEDNWQAQYMLACFNAAVEFIIDN